MRIERWNLLSRIVGTSLLLAASATFAVTPLRSVSFTSDVAVNLSGTFVSPYHVVNDSGPIGDVHEVDTGPLSDESRLTAFARRYDGGTLFAFDSTRTLDVLAAGLVVQPGDVLYYEPLTFHYSLRFHPQDYGIAPGVLVDAVTDYDPDLLLSFDTPVTLPALGGGTLTAGKEDLVRLVGSTGTFAMMFDGSQAGVPTGLNLDGADYVYTNHAHILMSFDGSGKIGGEFFDKDDIVDYDTGDGSFSVAYDGDALHDGWPPANLEGLAVETANVAVGGGRIVGRPGSSACFSPTLQTGNAPVGRLVARLYPVTGKITSLFECATDPAIGGGGPYGELTNGRLTAEIVWAAVLLPDGVSISCRVGLAGGLTPGTYILGNISGAANADYADYSPVSTTPATLAVTSCLGDCDANGSVSIGELQRTVNIFLGKQPLCSPVDVAMNCPISDASGDGRVSLGEVEASVTMLVAGCAADSSAKRMFITSTTHTGNLGGLAGADAICALRAASAGLPGTYKAWLSTDAVSAASRLSHWNGPYTLVDGTLIASGWADLTDSSLASPINETETGAPGNSYWSGTTASGQSTETGQNCTGWTSTSSYGDLAGGSLMIGGVSICSISRPLLCVQQ